MFVLKYWEIMKTLLLLFVLAPLFLWGQEVPLSGTALKVRCATIDSSKYNPCPPGSFIKTGHSGEIGHHPLSAELLGKRFLSIQRAERLPVSDIRSSAPSSQMLLYQYSEWYKHQVQFNEAGDMIVNDVFYTLPRTNIRLHPLVVEGY